MATVTQHYDAVTIGNLNRRFASELGWKSKYNQIRQVIGIRETLPGPMDFANAVAEWQARNPPLKTDGLLGPNTWRRMQPLTRMNVPSPHPTPAWLRMNTRLRVKYEVPMQAQGPNPICWVACTAMMHTYKNRSGVPISSLTGGLDPMSSSIPNHASNTAHWKQMMRSEGFGFDSPQGQRANEEFLASMLRSRGPLILWHYTTTMFGTSDPNSTHAVVITGIDTDKDVCYINNPWGTKDQAVPTDTVLNSIEQLWANGEPALIYLR